MDFDNTPSNFRQDLLNAYHKSRFERFVPEGQRHPSGGKVDEFYFAFEGIRLLANPATFNEADCLRSDIEADRREKRGEKDPYFEDQRNINAFLSNLEKAVEIRLETGMMEAPAGDKSARFATIKAIEITYLDGSGNTRKTGRGTRIEPFSHFRDLWNDLGGSDTEIVEATTRAGDREFERYRATIRGYFDRKEWHEAGRIDGGLFHLKTFGARVKPLAEHIEKNLEVFSPRFVSRFSTADLPARREESCEEVLELYNLNEYITAKQLARAIWNP